MGKKKKKMNLLELSDPEKIELMREVKEKLRQKIVEEKLWHSLLETENLTVNGNMVYKGNEQLKGLYFGNIS